MSARSGEPRLAGVVSWVVLGASFGLSAATWIALAVLAGFDATLTVPDLGVVLRLAWLMPAAIDGYVVVALVMWMSPVPARVARFARTNTYVAASIGVVAQSCYHALTTWSATGVTWRAVLAAVVGALPPAVAGLAVHMRALVRRESATRTPAGGISVPGAATHAYATTAPAPAAVPPVVAAPLPVASAPAVTAPADLVVPVPAAAQPEPVVPVVPAHREPVRKATPKRQPSAAERVAAAVARSPKASDAQIAARLKLSEKTVQRHRGQRVDSVSTEPDLEPVAA